MPLGWLLHLDSREMSSENCRTRKHKTDSQTALLPVRVPKQDTAGSMRLPGGKTPQTFLHVAQGCVQEA